MARISDTGISLLEGFEAFRSKWYQDEGGVWTIGYGHASNAEHAAGLWPEGLTREQARDLLRRDLSRFEAAVSTLVKVPQNEHQFDALVILAFNIGEGPKGFAGSTLLRLINAGETDRAKLEPWWLAWHHAGGKDSPGLLHLRRPREIALYFTPVPDQPLPVDELLAQVYEAADNMVDTEIDEDRQARRTLPDG